MSDHDKLREAIKQARARADYDTRANAEYASGPNADQHRLLADAAESTLPKTKMVSAWRCEYSVLASALNWAPCVSGYPTKQDADEAAARMSNDERYRCIRVTGPHQQEVPA